MRRDAMDKLVAWGESTTRKPLIVNGARQVGKTWLVKEYGRTHFDALAYVTFQNNPTMRAVFEAEYPLDVTIEAISAFTHVNASNSGTLIFLDEVQECPHAIQMLKQFCEQRSDLAVVVAGSLLGIALHEGRPHESEEATRDGISWPVGKVDYLDLHPMTFLEFLEAVGEEGLAGFVRRRDMRLAEAFSSELERWLRVFLYVGGMPEAVQSYVDTRDLASARSVQERLLRDYEHDFAKHVRSPQMTERLREVWRSVPAQLAREEESKRFVYSQVRKGGRGRDYVDPVAWLVDSGLVTKVSRVSKPGVPLAAYVDDTMFKLYLLDVGLLGAATGLDSRALVEGNRLFTEFKGVYAEQYICQQMVAAGGCTPYYWSNKDGRRAEVDFLYDHGGHVVPIEVKADQNVRGKSIGAFAQRNAIERCLRFSMLPYEDQGRLVNYPLWAANMLPMEL